MRNEVERKGKLWFGFRECVSVRVRERERERWGVEKHTKKLE